ncbi:MAG TPA: CDP-glucose 4,6-dehydratase [Acidobacteriaceae bacterium]|jgi:CDP-glucose 4,6-dehydratase|nr:CDP-glucose 4,6-dehydratase [Acidobacteriaceae bacterium]
MFWNGRKVFLTGHTGFKGGWLSLWLQQLGAEVCGFALEAPTEPNLFRAATVANGMQSVIGNIGDLPKLRQAMHAFHPEIVMHLAAQPLVRKSYEDPVGTYTTNVVGTANVLESMRACSSVRAAVVITTDKCYENKEWIWAYRENDRLGGHDPYSSSKACAELVVASYRNSFFSGDRSSQHAVALASARAGNVIGGGDWAQDRLMPDIMRAFYSQKVLKIRNPHAVRPWQHVLEPLRGYLLLAENLYRHGSQLAEAWNFGPEYSDARPVQWIVEQTASFWGPAARWEVDVSQHPHEAQTLKLDWSKASDTLGWKPVLHLEDALKLTADWYRAWNAGTEMRSFTCSQIEQYQRIACVNRAGDNEITAVGNSA